MCIKHFIYCVLFIFLVKSTNEETKSWDASKKLTWSDFRAAPNSETNAVALTASGISFGYSLKTSGSRIIDFTTTVEAEFYPNKSWYVQEKSDDYILRHEQLHFDITELYARKFREQLSKLTPSRSIKKKMDAIQKVINNDLNEAQMRYDAETEHSINMANQKRWEDFIAKELKVLDQFKFQ